MMTMVERVARAIFRANFHPDEKTETVEQCWNYWPNEHRKAYAAARAAIEAMCDPGHDITAAVVSPGDDRTQVVAMWNAMLDAALSEQPE